MAGTILVKGSNSESYLTINIKSKRTILDATISNTKEPRGFLDFSKQNPLIYNNLDVVDNYTLFYPILTFDIQQDSSIIEKLGLIEGEEFDVELIGNSSPFTSFIRKNTYAWSGLQNISSGMGGFAGNNKYTMVSEPYFNDVPRTVVYKNMTTSDIVKKVVLQDPKSPYFSKIMINNVFISDTTDPHTEYQLNETNAKFLQRIAKRAYSSINPNDPFFTFFNSRGEFYFLTLSDFFSRGINQVDKTKRYQAELIPQVPPGFDTGTVGTYSLGGLGQGDMIDPFMITQIVPLYGGAQANKSNYKKQFFVTMELPNSIPVLVGTTPPKTGLKEEIKINQVTNHKVQGLGGSETISSKSLVLNSLIEKDSRDYVYLGINNTVDDFSFVKGKANSYFVNSCFSYQLLIRINYNPFAVAGKLITLVFKAQDANQGKITELSGDWLILSSRTNYQGKTQIAYQELTLGRPGLTLDGNHPLLREFAV